MSSWSEEIRERENRYRRAENALDRINGRLYGMSSAAKYGLSPDVGAEEAIGAGVGGAFGWGISALGNAKPLAHGPC